MKSTIAVSSRVGVAILVLLTVATGVMTVVGLQSRAPVERSTTARDYAISLIGADTPSANSIVREKTMRDLLPNHLFRVGSATARPLADGIVFGTVSAVSTGATFSGAGDRDDGVEVAHGSARADWTILVLDVEVEYAVGEASGARTIRIGIAVDPRADLARAATGFGDLGHIVVVVDKQGEFGFDHDVYTVRQGGSLLGVVARGGVLSFPGLGENSSAFLDGLDTVGEVLAEAARSDVVTEVERAGASTEHAEVGTENAEAGTGQD